MLPHRRRCIPPTLHAPYKRPFRTTRLGPWASPASTIKRANQTKTVSNACQPYPNLRTEGDRVSRRTTHLSRFTFHVLRFTLHVSRLTFHTSFSLTSLHYYVTI